jgi:cytochrome P450
MTFAVVQPYHQDSHMSDRLPPGPPMFLALRELLATMTGGNDLSAVPPFLERLGRRYGGIVQFQVFGRRVYFVGDPVLIEEMLVTRAGDFEKGRGARMLRPIGGEGLLSSEPPEHLRRRRIMQPAFHRERVAAYGMQMVDLALEHCAAWRDGDELDVHREMTRLTLNVAAETLFSSDVRSQAQRFRAAFEEVVQTFTNSISTFAVLLGVLPLSRASIRFQRARAGIDALIYEIIERRRADVSIVRNDLLAMLLDLRYEDGRPMSDQHVRDEAMTMFIAGQETTASALTWTWYLLARHPEIAAQMRGEIDHVLGTRAPNANDLARLRLTRNVFAEAMRLYPPAWMLTRNALRRTSLGNYTVPAGSLVLVSQLVTHRNAAYWEDPDAFWPQRWDQTTERPKYAYFPFGGGNRMCIGEPFAWMEGVLILATIAQHFDLELVSTEPIAVEAILALRPRTPVRARLRKRSMAMPTTGAQFTPSM